MAGDRIYPLIDHRSEDMASDSVIVEAPSTIEELMSGPEAVKEANRILMGRFEREIAMHPDVDRAWLIKKLSNWRPWVFMAVRSVAIEVDVKVNDHLHIDKWEAGRGRLARNIVKARERVFQFTGVRMNGAPISIGGGAAGTWTFTNGGRTLLLDGTFDINSDSWKMALFLSSSDLAVTETTYAGVTNEHANANGYTTGGIAITLTLAGTTTVTVDISVDPTWTASGGSIVARFACIYEVGGSILVFCLLDSTPADVTVTDGNTLTVAAHASGVFTLA